MKKFLVMLLTLAMLLSVTACGGSGSSSGSASSGSASSGSASSGGASSDASGDAAEEPIIFACAHVDPEDSVAHQGMLKFEEYVEANTDGKVDVQIYPNGQMGGEREMVEAVAMGSLQMTVATASVMSAYHEKFNLLELPFLFADYESVYAAYDGELGELYGTWMEEQDLLNMGYYCGGMRAISNSKKPVYTPDDLKGLKIRCIESDMFMQLFQLLGTNPTPMNFNEVYTGLEQGTIDGQDNPSTLTYTSKFHEKISYFTQTNHVALCIPIIVQKSYYEALPEDIRTAMDEGFAIMLEYCRDTNLQFELDAIDAMAESGVEIIELTPEQMQLFQAAATPIHDQYREIVGDDVMDLALSY